VSIRCEFTRQRATTVLALSLSCHMQPYMIWILQLLFLLVYSESSPEKRVDETLDNFEETSKFVVFGGGQTSAETQLLLSETLDDSFTTAFLYLSDLQTRGEASRALDLYRLFRSSFFLVINPSAHESLLLIPDLPIEQVIDATGKGSTQISCQNYTKQYRGHRRTQCR
jgi:hypothetical protein